MKIGWSISVPVTWCPKMRARVEKVYMLNWTLYNASIPLHLLKTIIWIIVYYSCLRIASIFLGVTWCCYIRTRLYTVSAWWPRMICELCDWGREGVVNQAAKKYARVCTQNDSGSWFNALSWGPIPGPSLDTGPVGYWGYYISKSRRSKTSLARLQLDC